MHTRTILLFLSATVAIAARCFASDPTLILDIRAHAIWRVGETGNPEKFIAIPEKQEVAVYGADWRWIAMQVFDPKPQDAAPDFQPTHHIRVYDALDGHEIARVEYPKKGIPRGHERVAERILVDSENKRLIFVCGFHSPQDGQSPPQDLAFVDIPSGKMEVYPIAAEVFCQRPSLAGAQILVHGGGGYSLEEFHSASSKTRTLIELKSLFGDARTESYQGFRNISKGGAINFHFISGKGIVWTDGLSRLCLVTDRELRPLESLQTIRSEQPFCDLQLVMRGGKKTIVYGRQTGEEYFDTLVFRDVESGEELFSRDLPFQGFFLKASGILSKLRMFDSESGALIEYGIETDQLTPMATFGRAPKVGWRGDDGVPPTRLGFHEDLKILGTF